MKLYLTIVVLCVLARGSLSQVTCGDLGLFSPSAPFDGWPDPTCPSDSSLELIYDMYTGSGVFGIPFDRNDADSPTGFDAGLPTVFLAHGWSGDTNTGWMHETKDSLLANDNVNVVTVGWGGPGGAENLNYFESASTTRTVGAETAETMIWLASFGASLSDFHCAGHSLGAHVCGHFGRYAANAGSRPGRITGLDPAGPNFASNPDRTVGIYRDCGDFVDIIHTDTALGSVPLPGEDALVLGHQDWFPNDGGDQPGCGTSSNCNHGRAPDLFRASVTNPECYDSVASCTSSNDLPGSCSPCASCAVMGYTGSSSGGTDAIYTLPTGSDFPFC